MRKLLARTLAAATAVIVMALAAAFSLVQNAPHSHEQRPGPVAREVVPEAQAQRLAAGRAAYEKHGCAGCHAIGGQGNPRNPLDGVGDRLTPGAIRDWIVASDPVKPRLSAAVARIKQKYAALPEAELQALVDYLVSLPTPPIAQ